MMWGWGYGGGSWLGWLGPIAMVLFWGSVITGGVFLIRSYVRRDSAQSGEVAALELLRMRYVKGEISKEEFEDKRRDLVDERS